FPYFVGSMFVLAAGLCFLETAADTYVNVLGPPEHASWRLNLAQSFNALGVFFGPLIGGALFFQAGDPAQAQEAVQGTYLAIAIAVLIFAAIVAHAQLPELGADHGLDRFHAAPEGASAGPATLKRRH